MKFLFLFTLLFLTACAPDSKDKAPEEIPPVVTQAQKNRAVVLSAFYGDWKASVASVEWKKETPDDLRFVEAFLFGVVATRYAEFFEMDSLPMVLEAFLNLPSGDPEGAEMLTLARRTLEN